MTEGKNHQVASDAALTKKRLAVGDPTAVSARQVLAHHPWAIKPDGVADFGGAANLRHREAVTVCLRGLASRS